jgi:hypothetical protein
MASELFCAVASASVNFGSVSTSSGQYFASDGLVKLDCENLRQRHQNA